MLGNHTIVHCRVAVVSVVVVAIVVVSISTKENGLSGFIVRSATSIALINRHVVVIIVVEAGAAVDVFVSERGVITSMRGSMTTRSLLLSILLLTRLMVMMMMIRSGGRRVRVKDAQHQKARYQLTDDQIQEKQKIQILRTWSHFIRQQGKHDGTRNEAQLTN